MRQWSVDILQLEYKARLAAQVIQQVGALLAVYAGLAAKTMSVSKAEHMSLATVGVQRAHALLEHTAKLVNVVVSVPVFVFVHANSVTFRAP